VSHALIQVYLRHKLAVLLDHAVSKGIMFILVCIPSGGLGASACPIPIATVANMFFPFPSASDVTACPNCGTSGFNHKKKDYECEKCGFHKVESVQLPDAQMMFCEGCGCTYSDGCNIHPVDMQRPSKS
jgi:ribosomal protein L37E